MLDENQVLLEFVRRGNFVRVSAVDPVSGLEAVIVGSPSMPKRFLAQSALRKLRYLYGKTEGN